MFLKQINSSLVDSNMLVRCVTLSLDRFENQVDMKGKKRPERQCRSVQCGLAGVRHPAFIKETGKAGRSPTKLVCGWGQGGGAPGGFLCCFYFPLWFMLPLLSMYYILIRRKTVVATSIHKTFFLFWAAIAWDEKDPGGDTRGRPQGEVIPEHTEGSGTELPCGLW